MPLKTYRFDIVDFIKDPQVSVEYLKVVLEEGDDADIRKALNNVARAQGISGLARQTGLSREALYKAFGENGNPTLSTLLAVFKALGVRMSVEPAIAQKRKAASRMRPKTSAGKRLKLARKASIAAE